MTDHNDFLLGVFGYVFFGLAFPIVFNASQLMLTLLKVTLV